MRVSNKQILKISLSIIIALGLTACGGGDSNDDSNSGDNSGDGGSTSAGDGSGSNDGGSVSGGDGAGSGGCVTFPRPKVGQIVKRELKDADGDISFALETEIMAISNTSITQLIKGGFGGDSTNIQEYTIANNYRDLTKETVSFSGFNFITTYIPFQRIPIDKVCEGQTWTTTYTENDAGDVVNHSQTYIIEAVNISKTTPAGTFNTFRVKMEDIDIGSTAWIDIDSGYDVLSEFKLTSGSEGGSLELIEKNF